MDSVALRRREETGSPDSRFALARPSAEDLAWLGLVPAALLFLAAILWLAPPVSKLYPGPSQSVFPQWDLLIAPEPLEATRVLIAAAVPLIFAGVVLALGTRRPARRSLDGAVIAVQLVGMGFVAWSVARQIHAPGWIVTADYFDPLLLSAPVLVAGVVIGAALTALLVRKNEFRLPRVLAWADRPSGKSAIALTLALVFTAIWLLPAVVTDGTVSNGEPIASSHIQAFAQDYFAVVNGRTPLVDYIPFYVHLLPLALAPVLAAFNSSLTSFSISMSVLSLVAMLAVYGAFRAVTRGPWTALGLYVPFVAISLFPWDRQGAQWDYNGNYYAFFPGRYLGPFVVLWLCALSLRGRRLPAWVVFFAAGLATANNTEFGIPCVIATIVALSFGSDRSIPVRARASRLLLHAAAGLGAALALVCTVILARSGELPNPSYATYWSSSFARDGFGLAPMPTLGLHWALYFTYAAALLVATVRCVRFEPDRTLTGMLAFAGVFGILSGLYFGGRSLPWQLMLLFPVWGFALALLAWTVGLSLRSARGDWLRLRRLILPALATLAGFGVMVAAIDRFPAPWQQVDRLTAGGVAVHDHAAVQRFVAAHTNPGEHVMIIGTEVDHRIAERAGVANSSPFSSYFALLSADEVNRGIDFLEDDGGRKVFASVRTIEEITPTHRFPELARILRERGFVPLRTQRESGFVEWERR